MSRRTAGHLISGYIDDFHLQGDTKPECFKTVLETVTLFESLGFAIHPDKSQLMLGHLPRVGEIGPKRSGEFEFGSETYFSAARYHFFAARYHFR